MYTKSQPTLVPGDIVTFQVVPPSRPGRMRLLDELDKHAWGRQIEYDPAKNNRLPFKRMERGDWVFMPGYTLNRKKQPGLRTLSLNPYNENGRKVFNGRSTVRDGLLGVKVWRVA